MKKKDPYTPIMATELEVYTNRIFNQNKYIDLQFDNTTIIPSEIAEFNGCIFNRTKLSGDFSKCQFIDCIFDHCDLSGSNVTESRFHRVKFLGCKAIGVQFTKAKWQYVQIEDSLFSYGEFSDTVMIDVRLLRSDFSQSSFFTVEFQKITLDNVDFSSSDFSDTSMHGIDLSECKIDAIRVSQNRLKGLIVNSQQASALIRLLGVEVKE